MRTREHLYLALMVGTPLVAAVVLCRTPAPDAVCEGESSDRVEEPVAHTPPALACVDGLSELRRPATLGEGESIQFQRSAPLDASWTSFATASVRAIVGETSAVTTGVTPLPGRRALVVATTQDALGRPISAFTINAPDLEGGQVAHRICGHRLIGAYAVSPQTVEVQLDDGSAVWATPDRILPVQAEAVPRPAEM